MTCTKSGPPVGRLFAIERNVRPKSVDANTYGVKSLRRWLSNVTYTVLESWREGSMRLTYVLRGTPGKRPVRFSHVPPSLRDTHTLPSSVPAKRMPARTGDSASDTIVPYVSAPVTSGVRPPVRLTERSMAAESAVERSGEIATRLSPRFV